MRHYKLIRLAAILLIMYASTAEAGLIAWYPLHGDASAIVGDPGTLVNGPTAAPDQNGNANGALNFQALSTNSPGYAGTNSGSYVSVSGGAGLAGLEEFSIAMWVSWNGMQGTGWNSANFGCVIARQGDNVYSNNVLDLSAADPTVGVLTWHPYDAGGPVVTGITPVGDNVWHFVAVASDGSTGEQDVYLDGNLEATSYPASGQAPYNLNADTTGPLTIGAWIDAGELIPTLRSMMCISSIAT